MPDLVRYIVIGVLCVLECALINLLIDGHRLLRDMKDAYKEQYGREYRDEPGQIKKLACHFYGFLCRFFRLLRQSHK